MWKKKSQNGSTSIRKNPRNNKKKRKEKLQRKMMN